MDVMCCWCDFVYSLCLSWRERSTTWQVGSQSLNCRPICITYLMVFSWCEVLAAFRGVEFLCLTLSVSKKKKKKKSFLDFYIFTWNLFFLFSCKMAEMKWYSIRPSHVQNHDVDCRLPHLFMWNFECDIYTKSSFIICHPQIWLW